MATPLRRPRARDVRRSAALARPLLALAVTACASFAAARYRGPLSDHFDGRRFHNLSPTKDRQLDDALRIAAQRLTGRLRGDWPWWEATPTDTPPARVTGGALRVTFVNHATVLVQMDGVNVLTDPVWAERISPLSFVGPRRHRPPGIRFEELPPIDVVLLSHDHYDHLDLPTLRRVVARFRPRVIAGLGTAAYLAERGIGGARDIDWWETVRVAPGVTVTGVPAQHWSARTLVDRRRRLWLGFVLAAPSGRVYFAGDTGDGPFFAAIRDRLAPFRLALLPIGPGRPRREMAPRHVSAGEAVRIARLLGASTSLAIHFGTFQQGDDADREPVDSLRAALAAAGPCAPRFWALRNGEARVVPPGPTPPGATGACPRPTAGDSATGR